MKSTLRVNQNNELQEDKMLRETLRVHHQESLYAESAN